jgi:DNA mismatch endonuclease, patch repair protein
MRAIKRRDTEPEWQIRRRLHREGRRYRVDFPIRTEVGLVRPDIAFTRARLAIFIDGCYWHGCPEHGRVPRVNAHYWKPKLARNAERDRVAAAALEEAGWSVLRFWEHEDPEAVVRKVTSTLRAHKRSN